MRIGIDAMGGDHAPAEPVAGAVAARELLKEGDRIVLFGDETAILEKLASVPDWAQWIEICHAPDTISMEESPVVALRLKPNSSIAMMAQKHAEGEIDACISAGNTGACVAASQMRLRRLRGAHRPGIAVVAPTFHGPVVICDVGANVNCRPTHLYQYGVMASVYAKSICGIKNPRVGLLSIGEEDTKGTDLVKQTRELLKADKRINFIGNVEGRDVFGGVVDVMVTEGFVGNVMLKLMEGMAGGVMKSMLRELVAEMPELAEKVMRAAKAVSLRYDYNEYGGAPLLGVAGISIICHGASNYRAIKNAVRVVEEFSRQKVNEQIAELLADGVEDQ